MNIKIVNVLTHRYNYNFKQQLINMQFVFFLIRLSPFLPTPYKRLNGNSLNVPS